MLTKYKPVAAELFAAAWCNLDCKYCYIPKDNNVIIDKHRKIIKELKEVTPMIKRLKKLYGENLEIISHWGSEPSLTISNFKPFYKQVLKEFPNFNTISFSSNYIDRNKVKDVINFILTFPEDKKITFGLQMSLDGPPWITDENRRGGATDKIVNNMIFLVEELNKTEFIHKVKTHFKPTVSKTQYHRLLEDGEIYNYYKFFDNVCSDLMKANSKRRVLLSFGCDPTIVCPDNYTKEDGINFCKLYTKTQKIKQEKFQYVRPDSNYYYGFKKIGLLGNELFTKAKMFTCSAGDTQFGVSEYLHPCHDTFYLPYDGIDDAIIKDDDRSNSLSEANNVKTGRTKLAKNQLCKKVNFLSEKDITDYVYKFRAFHDHTKFRLSTSVAIIKEMAYAGQVSECYKNDVMAEILAAMVITRHSCPTGHKLYTGSINLVPIEYFRLFGNGIVEEFIKRFIKEHIK